ncbi:MAG TPA: ABC transporter permease [Dermatophilaceae bacterium]|jgi:putative ABC transport system permease protein
MFLALRDLSFAKGRFALMGLVIALMAVLGVILTGLASGLTGAGISGLRALPSTHMAFEASATGDLFSRSTVSLGDVTAYQGAKGVQEAAPLGNQLTHGVISSGASKGKQVDLAVFGVDPASFVNPAPKTGAGLVAGENGILISKEIANEGISIGDVITIDRVGLPLKVIGTVGSESFGHVGVVYAPLGAWQQIHYGLPGDLPAEARQQATAIALKLAGGADVSAIDSRLNLTTVTQKATYNASPGYQAESSTMTMIQSFLYVISALVVGAFFTVWTVQRKPEVALLKALGGSSSYILRDALAQVVAVLVGATALGTAVGWGLGMAMPDTMPFALDAPKVALASGLLIVLGLLGAAGAVRRITSVDPLTALGAQR